MTKNVKSAFTLAEILITLGVIGVVAAVTMPTLVTNVQERVRKEQVRTVKYKFTKATEKMNSLGKIGKYGDDNDATSKFVDELKKHLSIAKVCDNDHLAECWNGSGFTNYDGSTTFDVSELTTGLKLEALQFNSGTTKTMGIVTGDGTPIILVYGKECQALDETKQYTWSTVDGKPETNATAGCVSMVFDINGAKGPNKLGTDVRTMNSLLGMVKLSSYDALSQAECEKYKDELDIHECYDGSRGMDGDQWAGAVKACHDLGMHLPSPATLAQIATLQYGVQIGANDKVAFDYSTAQYFRIPYKPTPSGYSSPITGLNDTYWTSQEESKTRAANRWFTNALTGPNYYNERFLGSKTICLGD